MKNFIRVIGFSFTAFLLLFSFATADTITYKFQDNMIYWPGYSNGTWDDKDDDVGDPHVGEMRVTISDGMLNRVEIDVKDRLTYDSLFINTDFTGKFDDWNYYILNDPKAGISNLYSVSEDYQYTIFNSVSGREGHPNGIAMDSLTLLSAFSVMYSDVDDLLVYDFSDSRITLNKNFYIGYAPYCANDVTGGGNPVPEPATIILTGMGLLGLYRSRKHKKA